MRSRRDAKEYSPSKSGGRSARLGVRLDERIALAANEQLRVGPCTIHTFVDFDANSIVKVDSVSSFVDSAKWEEGRISVERERRARREFRTHQSEASVNEVQMRAPSAHGEHVLLSVMKESVSE